VRCSQGGRVCIAVPGSDANQPRGILLASDGGVSYIEPAAAVAANNELAAARGEVPRCCALFGLLSDLLSDPLSDLLSDSMAAVPQCVGMQLLPFADEFSTSGDDS
jgi:hypothetical protein